MEDQKPLSNDELKALRQVLVDAEHATWLRKKIFIIAPVVFAAVTLVMSGVNWVVTHLTFKP